MIGDEILLPVIWILRDAELKTSASYTEQQRNCSLLANMNENSDM